MAPDLVIEIEDPVTGDPVMAMVKPDYEPYYDANAGLDLIGVGGFGVDGSGDVYYDAEQASPGEQAQVGVSPTGEITLVTD